MRAISDVARPFPIFARGRTKPPNVCTVHGSLYCTKGQGVGLLTGGYVTVMGVGSGLVYHGSGHF